MDRLSCILAAALAASVYLTSAGAGDGSAVPLSAFRVLWQPRSAAEVALDPDHPGPDGKPSLRIAFDGRESVCVGTSVLLAPGQRLRVVVYAKAEAHHPDGIALCLRCLDERGKIVDWITLSPVSSPGEFQRLRSRAFEVAQGTVRADLFLRAQKVTGTVWLSDVRLQPVDLSPLLDAAMQARGPTTWGINDFFAYRYADDPTLSDTCAKLMAAAGFDVARLACWWGSPEQLAQDIQPGAWICLDRVEGRYDFTEIDRQLRELDRSGLGAGAVVIHGTPEWASGKTRDDLPAERKKLWRALRRPFFPPRDWRDYERFVHGLVSHCRGWVRTWEVMNEPNTPDSGLNYGRRDYVRYLRHAWRAAKKADPEAEVICGRVGAEWLGAMLREDPSVAAFFDGVVSHPYAATPEKSFAAVRREQLAMGLAGVMKPVHVTEIGYGEWHSASSPAAYEQTKARHAAEALRRLRTVSDYVYWWTSVRPGNQYGLLRDDGYCYRPMPAYWQAGLATGKLTREGGPVQAQVDAPTEPVWPGRTVRVRLVARNRTGRPQRVRFWPVGFVTDLGWSAEVVRSHEWTGVLPGHGARSAAMDFAFPVAAAGGRFPVGLAVMCSEGNSLALCTIHVACVASLSRPSASAPTDPESLAALSDRVLPANSWDLARPRFTWPGRRGTAEWVQYDFDRPRTVSKVRVYWMDTGRRQQDCRVPATWKVLYRAGDSWRQVEPKSAYEVAKDRLSDAAFAPARTDALRVEVQLRPGCTGGIHEWIVE